MRIIFLLLLINCSCSLTARNYYINPSSESPDEKGTVGKPWKSVDPLNESMSLFKGGDTIFFKKGELFSGKIIIKCSGKQNNPIVFMPYGEGAAMPLLLFKQGNPDVAAESATIWLYKSNHIIIDGFEISDDNINPTDHSILAGVKIGIAIDESNYIAIKNCHISLVGIGINMVGNNNLVDHCNMRNLRMVRNTEGGWDDYGANGIVIAGADNVISKCDFKDCWATSFDYEFDGGAIEMAGSKCSNNRIIQNTVMNCNGFMELGSTDSGVISNNYVADNTVVNCGDLLYINNDGPYAVEVKQLEFVNNIFIQTFPQLTKPKSMMAMAKISKNKNIVLLRNNIFWLPMQIDVARPLQFEGSQLLHKDNIYYLGSGKLNFPLDKSEVILESSSKAFKTTNNEAFFQNMDLFPFKFLLRYWYLLI